MITRGTVVGITPDNAVVVPAPVDYICWTERVGAFAARPDLRRARRGIWLSGRMSGAAQQGFAAQGWIVRETTLSAGTRWATDRGRQPTGDARLRRAMKARVLVISIVVFVATCSLPPSNATAQGGRPWGGGYAPTYSYPPGGYAAPGGYGAPAGYGAPGGYLPPGGFPPPQTSGTAPTGYAPPGYQPPPYQRPCPIPPGDRTRSK